MLWNNDPGQPNEYQIFGTLLLSPGTNKVLDGFIMSPIVVIYEGMPVYMFVFGGCVWQYVIGNRPIEKFLPISLSTNGTLKMTAHDLQRVTPINRFFVEEVSNMKLPE